MHTKKTATTLEEQILMQCGLNLITKPLNNRFEIFKNRVNDASRRHIPKRRATINNPSWINNDVKQAIGRRQRAYEAKRMINNEETVAEYTEAKRQVKRIV